MRNQRTAKVQQVYVVYSADLRLSINADSDLERSWQTRRKSSTAQMSTVVAG